MDQSDIINLSITTNYLLILLWLSYRRMVVVVIMALWMIMAPIGSLISCYQLVELSGKDRELWHCWRSWASGIALWGFKRLLGFSVHSKICQQWGKGLSEAQQREAQDLFLEFGCSVFLSNQMPYNGSIPDTHNARCTGPQCSLVMNFGSHAKERVDRGLSYISSCVKQTPKKLSFF